MTGKKRPAVKQSQLALQDPGKALLLEQELGKKDESLAYVMREFAQCSFPYSDPGDVEEWERKNGELKLIVRRGGKTYPIPHGTLPRLIIFWLCSQIMERRDKKIPLSGSLTAALREFGYADSTANRGKARQNIQKQVLALLTASIQFRYENENETQTAGRNKGLKFDIGHAWDFWWDTTRPDQDALFESYITVKQEFFDAVINSPVPIPARTIRNHVKSPLELDLLVTLNHRNHRLNQSRDDGRAEFIPYMALFRQFGQDYNQSRPDNFRPKLARALKNIQAKSWAGLRYTLDTTGLTVHRSPMLVKPKTTPKPAFLRQRSDADIIAEIMATRRFDDETMFTVAQVAPRWDKYALVEAFWYWVDEGHPVATDPRPMFLSFCKSHSRKNRA